MIVEKLIIIMLGIAAALNNATLGSTNCTSSMPYDNQTRTSPFSEDANTTDQPSANRTRVSSVAPYLTKTDSSEENATVTSEKYGYSNITSTDTEMFSQSPYLSVKNKNDYVYMIIVPVCFVVGCTGNSLSVFTMITLPFRTMTWSIILTGLAIVDTIMLCAIAINKPFVIDMMGMDVLAISNAGCKTFHFVRRAAKMASSWLVVVICIERFFAICYPLKVKKICTRHNTIAAMVVIGSVAITFSGLSTENVGVRGSACLPSIATNETRVQGKVMLLLGSSLSGVAPMLILITLTPIICWTLVRHRRARTVMTSSAKLADPYTRVSAMLVSVHMSYIILVLPMFVDINLKFMRPFSAAVYDEEIMEVFGKFSRICEMINHSINFFLYVGFNSLFRRRLAQAFSRSVSVDRSNADLMG